MNLTRPVRAWSRATSAVRRPLGRVAMLGVCLAVISSCGFFDEEPSDPVIITVDRTWSLLDEMAGRDERFGSYVPSSLVSVYEDQREVVLLQEGFEVVFRQTPLFKNARLQVELAVPSLWWPKLTGPVTFRVYRQENGERREILRRDLDPANVPGDRQWTAVEVGLPGGAPIGREIELILAAEGPDAALGRIAAWSRPRVVSEGRLLELTDDPLVGTVVVKDLLSEALEAHRSETEPERRQEGVEPFGLKLPNEPGEIPSLRIRVGSRLDLDNVFLPDQALVEVELFAIGVKLDPIGELVYRVTMRVAGSDRDELIGIRRLDARELQRFEFGFRTLRERWSLPVRARSATLSVEVSGTALDEQVMTGVSRLRVLAEELREVRPRGSKPNVLVLLVDTLRADHLGAYGYDRDTSPNFDRLAERGQLFRNAVAQSSWTLPSTASLLTGLYPQTHGSLEGATIRLRRTLPTLPELVFDQSIATGGFAANFIISEKNGFDRGFQKLEELFLQPAAVLNESAVEWVRRQGGRPFFGYVHYFDPHSPYAPPAPYDTMFTSLDIDPERARDVVLRWTRLEVETPLYSMFEWKVAPEVEGDFHVDVPKRELILSEWLVQHWIDRYDGEIRYWDDQLGHLLGELEAEGVLDNTWILITSDHGEAFGEHAFFGHGTNLHDELIRVPFLIVPPGNEPGRVIDEPVELIDIFPTVLSIFGLPVPEGAPGRVLAPRAANDRSAGFSFVRAKSYQGDVVVTRERGAVRSPSHKVIAELSEDGPVESFDLRQDPGEQRPLSSDDQAALQESLRDQLSRWHRKTPRGMSDDVPTLDPAIREKLIRLGYLSEVGPQPSEKKKSNEKSDKPR